MAFEYKFIRDLNEDLKTSLSEDYKIDEFDIEDVFTNTQLSKVEQRPKYLYIALQFPEYNKEKRHFLNKEVHCFVSDEYFLIVDKHNFKHIKQFDDLKDQLVEDDFDAFSVFYEMLDFVITKIFRVLNKFRQEINSIETSLFDAEFKVDQVSEIQIVKRNLINFISIVYPLENVITGLQVRYSKFIDKEGLELLDDSLDKLKKMVNNLSNFKEQMGMITETNEALIARSTNDTIKMLTAVNLIAVIPTAVTSFFGMNVYFGWDMDTKDIFPLVSIIISVIMITTLSLFYFRRKGWI